MALLRIYSIIIYTSLLNLSDTQQLPPTNISSALSTTGPPVFLYTTTLVGGTSFTAAQTLTSLPTTVASLPQACEGCAYVQKCCPENQLFNVPGNFPFCVDPMQGEDLWKPPEGNFHVVVGFPQSKGEEIILQYKPEEFSLLSNGSIHFTYKDDSEIHGYQSYCIDLVRSEDGCPPTVTAAISRVLPEKTPVNKVADHLHFAGATITCISLAILVVLEFTGVRKNGDFNTLCLLSMVFAMFWAYFALILNNSDVVKGIEKGRCIALAITQQFFFLSFYFWLNVKCIEIYRNVRGSIEGIPISLIRGHWRRYFIYACYAWGIPIVVSCVTLGMQLLPTPLRSCDTRSFLTPRIAEGRCWFAESMDILFSYYYGIQLVLHVSNVVLIAYSGYLMFYKRQKIDEGNEFHSSNRDACLKLFWQQLYILSIIVIVWTLDTVTLIKTDFWFWRIVDVLNSLQGLYLLILVILRDKELKKKIKSAISATNSTFLSFSSSAVERIPKVRKKKMSDVSVLSSTSPMTSGTSEQTSF